MIRLWGLLLLPLAGCATLSPAPTLTSTGRDSPTQTAGIAALSSHIDTLHAALIDELHTTVGNLSAHLEARVGDLAADVQASVQTTAEVSARFLDARRADNSQGSHNTTNDVWPWLIAGVGFCVVVALLILGIFYIQWAKFREMRRQKRT